jgi:hypothetical protein
MSKDVAVKQESLPPVEYAQTPQQIKAQVVLIQEIMRDVMTDGQHYGTIPGCGDKPCLFKSGAEKLSLTFRLRPIMDEGDVRVEELPNGHKNIRVDCHIMNQAGLEIATGVGSCSTMESKFRYRGAEKISTGVAVPAKYWDLKKSAKFAEMQDVIGGKGYGVLKTESGAWEICTIGQKMEHPDIADTYNTVLKMAKKRAYVDGILSATAASDCFTQDIDEMHEPIDVTPEPVKPVVAKAAPVKQAPPAEASKPPQETVAEAEVVKPKDTPVAQKKEPQPGSLTCRGVIEDKKIKPFVNNGKAGNKYGVKIEGKWMGTFDSKIYADIETWQKMTPPVLLNVEYVEQVSEKDSKTYLNLVSIKPVVANDAGGVDDDI